VRRRAGNAENPPLVTLAVTARPGRSAARACGTGRRRSDPRPEGRTALWNLRQGCSQTAGVGKRNEKDVAIVLNAKWRRLPMPSSLQYPMEQQRDLQRRWGRLLQRTAVSRAAPIDARISGSGSVSQLSPKANPGRGSDHQRITDGAKL